MIEPRCLIGAMGTLARFRMTSPNWENGFVGQAVVSGLSRVEPAGSRGRGRAASNAFSAAHGSRTIPVGLEQT